MHGAVSSTIVKLSKRRSCMQIFACSWHLKAAHGACIDYFGDFLRSCQFRFMWSATWQCAKKNMESVDSSRETNYEWMNERNKTPILRHICIWSWLPGHPQAIFLFNVHIIQGHEENIFHLSVEHLSARIPTKLMTECEKPTNTCWDFLRRPMVFRNSQVHHGIHILTI